MGASSKVLGMFDFFLDLHARQMREQRKIH